MFVETQRTPNPATLKFIPDQEVLETGSRAYRSSDEAAASPLARLVFDVEGVRTVMLGQGFLSVTIEGYDWQDKKPEVLSAIMEHYLSDQPVVMEGGTASVTSVVNEDDSEAVTQIKAILEEKIRPAVTQDGGDVIFHEFREGVVYLKMQGACDGCPSATMTLKHGIENLLKYYVPEVVGVEQI